MIDGIYFALAAAALILAAAAFAYHEWQLWDAERRVDRLVHRNLHRMTGGQR